MSQKKHAEFTNTEIKLIYMIVDEFGGKDRKQELMRELKSLLRYDRMIFKSRITRALSKIL